MADFAQKIRYTIDIDSGLVTAPQRAQLTKGDRSANKIVVTVTEKGKPFDLSGVTVSGRFYRPPDAAEVTLGGSAAGNVATVVFNDHCYTAEGYYEAEVVLTQGSIKRTILSISGHVRYGGGGAYIDIENVVPSLDDIIALYSEMRTETNRCIAAANRAENMQMDANGMAGDSNMLGGRAPGYYIQAHNLLDNSDFKNPVNQRGQTNYTAAGEYTIDRWNISANAASLNVNSGGVTLTAKANAYGYLRQYIEWKRVAGKTVTFAACTSSGVIAAATVTMPSSAPSADTTFGGANVGGMDVYIGGDASRASVQIRTALGGSLGLAWAALYEGAYTAETLPPHIPKGYAAELAECKRYFQRLGASSFAATIGFGIIQNSASKYIRIFVPLPQELRTTPTATFTGTITVMGYSSAGGITTTAESIVGAYATSTGTEIVMVSADAIVAHSNYIVRMNSNSYLSLSADL